MSIRCGPRRSRALSPADIRSPVAQSYQARLPFAVLGRRAALGRIALPPTSARLCALVANAGNAALVLTFATRAHVRALQRFIMSIRCGPRRSRALSPADIRSPVAQSYQARLPFAVLGRRAALGRIALPPTSARLCALVANAGNAALVLT